MEQVYQKGFLYEFASGFNCSTRHQCYKFVFLWSLELIDVWFSFQWRNFHDLLEITKEGQSRYEGVLDSRDRDWRDDLMHCDNVLTHILRCKLINELQVLDLSPKRGPMQNKTAHICWQPTF